MKIEEIRTGCIRIWLSDKDMVRYGITYSDMQQGDARTDKLLRCVLAVVAQYTGHAIARYTVEALDTGDGCLLLVTASPVTASVQPPFVCKVSQTAALFRLAEDWYRVQPTTYSELYAADDGYILIVHPTTALSATQWSHLRRYADSVDTGEVAAAAAAEHSTPIAQGDVLQRLAVTARAPDAPNPTEPAH